MIRVFVAGPIDFHSPSEVLDYRLTIRDRLEAADYTPVDQYTDLLELFVSIDRSEQTIADVVDEMALPDEPFVEAVQQAIAATSLETVLADPGVVPEHTSDAVVDDIVQRDFDILERSDAVLAYLPTPSCGTMAEIIRATELDRPVVVVADRPPHYVRYYADDVVDSIDRGVGRVDALL